MFSNKLLFVMFRHVGSIQHTHMLFFSKSIRLMNNLSSSMKKLIDAHQYQEALDLFHRNSACPSDFTTTLAFKACAKLKNLDYAIHIHKQLSSESLNNIYIHTSLIHLYMTCNDADNAYSIFDKIENKSCGAYGAMFKGLIKNEQYEKVFQLYDQMLIEPNDVTLNLLFTACGKLPNEQAAKIKNKYLNQISKLFTYDNYVLNSFLYMLMSFGDISQAQVVFAKMKRKDIVTYGTMMQGLIKNEQYEKVFQLYDQMLIEPNDVILNLLFTACAKLPNEDAAKIKNKYLNQISKLFTYNKYVLNSFLYMLMNFGDISQAETIFTQIKKKDIVTYGMMMQGFFDNKMFEKTLDLFEQMPFDPDEVILTILFKTCAQLANKRAFELARKSFKTTPTKFYNHPKLLTSTLHMLLTFGAVKNAEKLFYQINTKNNMHYGVMMDGYNMNNQPDKCLELFKQIQKQNHIVVNDAIYTFVLDACSQIGFFTTCQSVIDQIPSSLLMVDRMQCTLIDLWGKVGYINKALEIFQQIQKPDLATYTAMINSFGLNGMGNEAIQLYQQIPMNLRTEITHVCILNACSHSGLINQAYSIYAEIPVKTDRIVTTMVDCLSRLSMFNEAEELINQYESSHSPYMTMYMALLSGTRNHRQHHLTQKIYDKMQSRFPNRQEELKSASILLENTYRAVGEYDEAAKVRLNQIKHFGKRTVVGISWTEANGQLVKFKAHDRSHPDSDKIYEELNRISTELLQYGHQYDSSWITRPLNDDETNSALKLIAKIRQRPMIVRDTNRLHHFHVNGQCSCQDHF